ncbi:MAG: beta-lactamase family protein [Labilithrix sp.]|nr:beta-lactamase family protein [Labilithrix sp.]
MSRPGRARGIRLGVALLAAALASCRGCADGAGSDVRETAAKESGRTTGRREALDVESFRARARVPAVGWASVTRGSESSGAAGTADVERDEPAGATTAFEAASIAKTIIATSVMQLVEEGKLALDADVSSYVGFAVRHPRAPITLRHLLTHTAAIADGDETRASGGPALGDFLGGYFADAGSRGIFLDAPPGTSMRYSNVGPSLAALAVERATGVRFAEHARARVFAPLGMRATAFGLDALAPGTRVAAPYAARGASFHRLPAPSHALYPVVDLFSSPRDLARFARAILRGGELDGARVLSQASVDEMLRVQLLDAAPDDALGWQVRRFEGRLTGRARVVVGHEGEDAGASTGLYLDVAAGAGAVVVANGDAFQSGEADRAAALGDLVEHLLASAPR